MANLDRFDYCVVVRDGLGFSEGVCDLNLDEALRIAANAKIAGYSVTITKVTTEL